MYARTMLDVAETRGFALSMPKAKKGKKRLDTRDTLHESRPNLRQRDPNGRIVPTSPNVSDKGASTKRCVRRKKNATQPQDTVTVCAPRVKTCRSHGSSGPPSCYTCYTCYTCFAYYRSELIATLCRSLRRESLSLHYAAVAYESLYGRPCN